MNLNIRVKFEAASQFKPLRPRSEDVLAQQTMWCVLEVCIHVRRGFRGVKNTNNRVELNLSGS